MKVLCNCNIWFVYNSMIGKDFLEYDMIFCVFLKEYEVKWMLMN